MKFILGLHTIIFLKIFFDTFRASYHFTHQIYVRYSHRLLLNQFPFPCGQLSVSCNQESGSHELHKLLLSALQKETVCIITATKSVLCFSLIFEIHKMEQYQCRHFRKQVYFPLNLQLKRYSSQGHSIMSQVLVENLVQYMVRKRFKPCDISK